MTRHHPSLVAHFWRNLKKSRPYTYVKAQPWWVSFAVLPGLVRSSQAKLSSGLEVAGTSGLVAADNSESVAMRPGLSVAQMIPLPQNLPIHHHRRPQFDSAAPEPLLLPAAWQTAWMPAVAKRTTIAGVPVIPVQRNCPHIQNQTDPWPAPSSGTQVVEAAECATVTATALASA